MKANVINNSNIAEGKTFSEPMSFEMAKDLMGTRQKMTWGTRTKSWHIINQNDRDYNMRFSVGKEVMNMIEIEAYEAVTGNVSY